MKKTFLGLMFLAGLAASLPADADDDRWGAFVLGSEVVDESGFGAGVFMDKLFDESIYLTTQAFIATYDEADRGQVLIGGEWRDEGKNNLIGYIGLQAGADLVDTDLGSDEDMFARAYYDIGWEYSRGSQIRFGFAIDAKSEYFNRETGARFGWYHAPDEGFGFFVRGEVYEDETNVFAGGSWGF